MIFDFKIYNLHDNPSNILGFGFLECWRSNILNTLQIITIYNNFEVQWSVIKHSEDIKPQKYLSKNKKGTHEKIPTHISFKIEREIWIP